jgi:hypothetical protein
MEVVNFTPRSPLPPGKNPGTHWTGGRVGQELVEAFWKTEKPLPLPKIWRRTVQPQRSRHTVQTRIPRQYERHQHLPSATLLNSSTRPIRYTPYLFIIIIINCWYVGVISRHAQRAQRIAKKSPHMLQLTNIYWQARRLTLTIYRNLPVLCNKTSRRFYFQHFAEIYHSWSEAVFFFFFFRYSPQWALAYRPIRLHFPLSPTLSIFSLPAPEDLFLLLLSILSWVFLFVLSLPVIQ